MSFCLYNEGGNANYVVGPILIVFASFLGSTELYFFLLYSSMICVKKEKCIWIVVWVVRKLCIWDKTISIGTAAKFSDFRSFRFGPVDVERT